MKIVSVVVFAVALLGTWALTRSKAPVSEFMHVGIQNDIKRIIGEYVQKNLPQSKNLHFEKFWTETVKKDKVKAFFVYSFDDATQENGEATIEIEGSATLNKVSETAETVTWSLDELQIKDNHVQFQEPIHITAGANAEANVSGEPPAAAPETNGAQKQETR